MVPAWALNMLRLTFWSITYLTVFLLAVLTVMPAPLPSPVRWVILTLLITGIVLDARQKSAPSPK